MSRKSKLFVWIGISAAVALAAVGGLIYRILDVSTSDIAITNSSTSALSNARLVWAGGVVWTGDIPPGSTHQWRGRPGGEGDVELVFDAEGRTISTRCCYVTVDIGSSIEFAVSPTLEVTPTDRTFEN